jgi:hypothetical protein
MRSTNQPWIVVAVLAAALLVGMRAHAEVRAVELANPIGTRDQEGERAVDVLRTDATSASVSAQTG